MQACELFSGFQQAWNQNPTVMGAGIGVQGWPATVSLCVLREASRCCSAWPDLSHLGVIRRLHWPFITCAFREWKRSRVSCCLAASWQICFFDQGIGVWCGGRLVKGTPPSTETNGSVTPVPALLWSLPHLLWQRWREPYLQLLNRKPGIRHSHELGVRWWEGLNLNHPWMCALHWRPGYLLSNSRMFISRIENT